MSVDEPLGGASPVRTVRCPTCGEPADEVGVVAGHIEDVAPEDCPPVRIQTSPGSATFQPCGHTVHQNDQLIIE
jgi:hypothetical protein